jgi:hypothetical protein
VLIAAVAIAVASSGGGEQVEERSGPEGVALVNGEKLQSARCSDWRAADAREREDVVAALVADTAGSTPYGPATTLSPQEGYSLLERSCAQPHARNFLLYVLFTRAAGFKNGKQRLQ